MSRPICDFVENYCKALPDRYHMPGHKGRKFLGCEPYDITEIDGADELFLPSGIIEKSEAAASRIFGAKTLYSAGGSTLCIQTMLYLTALLAREQGEIPKILAGRNAHRAFINAAALLNIEIGWLYPKSGTYETCRVSEAEVDEALKGGDYTAVYLTSPDYLGNTVEIQKIAAVCHQRGLPLLVDNAHGAYLKFLKTSQHPVDLGADLCCDSAHKTLPVLTGGAYLHIKNGAPKVFFARARSCMALFGSSSPSYLILQSLDLMNDNATDFKDRLREYLPKAEALKREIRRLGFLISGDEPLKLTILPNDFGYSGSELNEILIEHRIFSEYHDEMHLVLMLSPYFDDGVHRRLLNVLSGVKKRPAIKKTAPPIPRPEAVLSPNEALFCKTEEIPTEKAQGRISGVSVVGCPPAVPLVVSGERIDEAVIDALRFYKKEFVTVIAKET